MRFRLLSWSLVAGAPWLLTCVACSSSKPSAEACTVTAPSACPTPSPVYADVAPIFDRTCATCHTGKGDDPWSLSDYQDVADWQDLVRGALLDCSMPPPDADVHITDEQRLLILNWVRCGAPE